MEKVQTKVKDVLILSEKNTPTHPDTTNVKRCWKRGESMAETMQILKNWQPDFVIVQHEFGIFPKATHFLAMLQALKEFNYIVTLHSVYEHLDKTICTSAIDNIVVHTEEGKDCLQRLGHNQNIFVVPHGCPQFEQTEELWNIFQTPYTLVQFGFGFFYKGVDRAIDAIHHLKSTDPKFQNIFYCYLCSDSGHFNSIFNDYYNYLNDKIETLGLQENVSIVRKFHSEQTINNYLRCAKIALFPYITNPLHVVYGSSGAIRVAMANKIPVIASEGHMFDDLEGVVPRPHDHISLAKEIDEIFSNDQHKARLLLKAKNYMKTNTWDHVADKYLNLYYEI
jgi:glycosyltransferase involved in cell wall biosynthesis